MILKPSLQKQTAVITLCLLGYLSSSVFAEEPPSALPGNPTPNIVFIGNSFMFGASSPVQFFRTCPRDRHSSRDG